MSRREHWGDRASVYDMWSRRHYLVATVGIAALSGCGGDTGDETETTAPPTDTEPSTETEPEDDDDEERPEGVSEEEFVNGPVPDVYLSATSLANEQRDPDNLNAKADVAFSEYETALENDAHQPGTCCGNCGDFIPDKNGDEFGACAEVDGYIDRAGWCTIYEPLPEPAVPEGMEEADLATAEVPEPYRSADSQVGVPRNPDDLLTQENVRLMESVEAIADEIARPGQSCGNCAEYIPDKNGDGWGACARVEGYVAVEDWCAVWRPLSAEL